MLGIDNNKLMELFITARRGLLLSQEHIKKEKMKTIGASLGKNMDSKWAYYSIIIRSNKN